MTALWAVDLGRNVELVGRSEGVGASALFFPFKVRERLIIGSSLRSESESEI